MSADSSPLSLPLTLELLEDVYPSDVYRPTVTAPITVGVVQSSARSCGDLLSDLCAVLPMSPAQPHQPPAAVPSTGCRSAVLPSCGAVRRSRDSEGTVSEAKSQTRIYSGVEPTRRWRVVFTILLWLLLAKVSLTLLFVLVPLLFFFLISLQASYL